MPATESPVHLYPSPDADSVGATGAVDDAYIVFYLGGNKYTWAAAVREVIPGDELSRLGVGLDDRAEPVLVLDVPFPISINSYDLHEQIGLEQEALTRFLSLTEQDLSTILSDHETVREYLIESRESPTIWIEKTELEGRPYKQPGGDLELGTAIFSKSRDRGGARRYESLREAEGGDIVLHLLQDRHEIVGLSVVASTLQEDFEGPPDGSWEEEAVGEGYLRPLARYEELAEPIQLYEDVLENADYGSEIDEIYASYDDLCFDKNRQLREGAYFTEYPLPLLYLFIAEAPELRNHISAHHYEVPLPSSTDSYGSVKETVTDVKKKLAFVDRDADWFADNLTATIVEVLTETLTQVQPNAELTEAQAAHCELLAQSYDDIQPALSDLVDRLGIGRTNQVSPPKALFFVLFRELQRRAGVAKNMNQVKLRAILNESYTVETPRPELIDPDTVELIPEPAPPERADDIARQLSTTGQMVFYGPPGTGKTYTAQQFAKWWLHQQADIEPDTRYLKTITFHPSFSYEDFIEGLSATVTDNDTVAYEHEDGAFKEFAMQARAEYETTSDDEEPLRYVLIIDEINRGNLAQIFGETMTGLEYDKRLGQPNETVVSLAHTGTPFAVPPNLYIIGTMNTADRSIALVDTALRRRFRFLSFPSNFEALYRADTFPFDTSDEVREAADAGSGATRLLALSVLAVQHFNSQIVDTADLGKGKQIGHSFFFGVTDTSAIVDLWRFEILPLLEQYFFGQFERIGETLFAGGGDSLLDYEREEIREFDAGALEETLEQLIETTDPGQ